ncbi:MAG: hypothetical protein ACE5K8_10170, partial [Candidatus Zixiibacteriota bacterium]
DQGAVQIVYVKDLIPKQAWENHPVRQLVKNQLLQSWRKIYLAGAFDDSQLFYVDNRSVKNVGCFYTHCGGC